MACKIMLCKLNPHIVCRLCQGYFIDPVTVTECLHSFCKSCIVRHVETSKKCPTCDGVIHKTKPLVNLRVDTKLQEIVYKLVPGLCEDERRRRHKFAKKTGTLSHSQTATSEANGSKLFFCESDLISLSIEYYDDPEKKDAKKEANNAEPVKLNKNKRYLNCPGMLKVKHLKKFLSKKYGLQENHVIDVIHGGDIIPDEYTLIDVAYLYNWKKDAPLKFHYRIFVRNRLILRKRKRNRAEEAVDGGKDSPVAKDPRKNGGEGRDDQDAGPGGDGGGGGGDAKRSRLGEATKGAEEGEKGRPAGTEKQEEKKVEDKPAAPSAPAEKDMVELSVNVSASDVKKVVDEMKNGQKQEQQQQQQQKQDKQKQTPSVTPTSNAKPESSAAPTRVAPSTPSQSSPKKATSSASSSPASKELNLTAIMENLAKKRIDLAAKEEQQKRQQQQQQKLLADAAKLAKDAVAKIAGTPPSAAAPVRPSLTALVPKIVKPQLTQNQSPMVKKTPPGPNPLSSSPSVTGVRPKTQPLATTPATTKAEIVFSKSPLSFNGGSAKPTTLPTSKPSPAHQQQARSQASLPTAQSVLKAINSTAANKPVAQQQHKLPAQVSEGKSKTATTYPKIFPASSGTTANRIPVVNLSSANQSAAAASPGNLSLPPSRLQLKVQGTTLPGLTSPLAATLAQQQQQQQQQQLAKLFLSQAGVPSVTDLQQWAMAANAAAMVAAAAGTTNGAAAAAAASRLNPLLPPSPSLTTTAAAAAAAAASAKVSSPSLQPFLSQARSVAALSKTLNQSVRQIPNPSLLTKQSSIGDGKNGSN